MNLIAVEVHHSSVQDLDLAFDLQLEGVLTGDRPTLEIAPTESGVGLSWQAGYEGWQVQQALDLTGPWVLTPGAPFVFNAKYWQSIPLQNTRQFFRLYKP
jgi:hypothetical protein